MASKLLLSLGVNASLGSEISNVFLCDTEGDLPSPSDSGDVAIINTNPMEIFRVNSSLQWVKKEFGVSLESCWPLRSVYMTTAADNPADLLGFGKWQEFKQEIIKEIHFLERIG